MLRFVCTSLAIPAWFWSAGVTWAWFNATTANPAPYPFLWVLGSWLLTWAFTAGALRD